MKIRIMVIAGTKDAKEIITGIIKPGREILATVTTGYGKQLLENIPGLKVMEGAMDSSHMFRLIKKHEISFIIDASHPFAAQVSVNAMNACENAGIDYLRYEREDMKTGYENAIYADDFLEAAKSSNQVEGSILLATGSKNLNVFTENITGYKERLFVRVLPESSVIEKCESMGLASHNIFAAKGPFSREMNIEMLKHCGAKVLVTKESGSTGGAPAKVSAAEFLNIPIIIIKRPGLEYRDKVSRIIDVERWLDCRIFPCL